VSLKRTLSVAAAAAAVVVVAVVTTQLSGFDSTGPKATASSASPLSSISATPIETRFIVAGTVSISTPKGMNTLKGSTQELVTIVDLGKSGGDGHTILIAMHTTLPSDGGDGYVFEQGNSAYARADLTQETKVGCGLTAYTGAGKGAVNSELDLYIPSKGMLVTSLSSTSEPPIVPTTLFTICVNS